MFINLSAVSGKKTRPNVSVNENTQINYVGRKQSCFRRGLWKADRYQGEPSSLAGIRQSCKDHAGGADVMIAIMSAGE